jgi:hypothetical protein
MRPGWCRSKAHDRENLGLGGRRVLVSRQWSGKNPLRLPPNRGGIGYKESHAREAEKVRR